MTLKEKLKERVARETLLEMGLLLPHQDTNFSRNLSGAAHNINKHLQRRPSIDKLLNTIYKSPESAAQQAEQAKLNNQMKSKPTISAMMQKDMIQQASINDYVITIFERPAGIRFIEGNNFKVRSGSSPETLGVSKNDLLVSINTYNVEKLHANKVINLFRTMKLPMNVRFRKHGSHAHSQMVARELAQGTNITALVCFLS